MSRRRPLAGLVVLVAAGALVGAQSCGADVIRMQALMNPDGSGHLFVDNSGGLWSWEACGPKPEGCASFGRGREIDTWGARPGAVFRVKDGGRTAVSPEWRGRLRQVSPPTVHGAVRADEFVSPLPGRWSGGWHGEFSQSQLSACETPTGGGCTTLTDPHYVRDCAPGSSFVVDSRFAGSYLRVANRRVGVNPTAKLYAVSSPYGGKAWRAGRITSVAVVGRIAPAVAPYPGECGPPPPGEGSISGRGVAFVRCGGGCRAVLIASHAGRQARVVRGLPPLSALVAPPPAELRVSRMALVGLGAGNVRLTVKIDGKAVARRTLRPSAERPRQVSHMKNR